MIETVTASKAGQAITVTTHAPRSAVYNTGFSVAATGGASGNAVSFSSAGACSNSGAAFTMTSGTGTCSVKYDQAGDSNYNAATEVTETVTAVKAAQSITITTHAPATAAYQLAVHGGGDRAGRGDLLLQRRGLHPLRPDVHDDQREGNVHGQVRPSR